MTPLPLARIRRRVYSTFVALAARRSGPTTPMVGGMTTAHAVSDGGRRALLRKTLCACAVVVFTAGITHRAAAATTTIGFEPPEYTVEQSVVTVPGATLSPGGEVYAPGVTRSGSNALRSTLVGCVERPGCPNGANVLSITFTVGMSAVSMAVGAENGGGEFCFPEGDTCPVWARLVGRDATGAPIV